MSTLIEFSMFPLGHGESVSEEVSLIIDMIRGSGHAYKLTPMGTIIETSTLEDALVLVERAYSVLENAGCQRVYASIKLDIRKGKSERMEQKIGSVMDRIGNVDR